MSERWEKDELSDGEAERLLSQAPEPQRLDPARRAAIWQALETRLAESGGQEGAPQARPKPGPRMTRLWPAWAALPFAAGLLVALGAATLYFVQHGSAPPLPGVALGRIEEAAGGCLLATAPGREAPPARDQVLNAGNILRTGPDGAARLRLADGSTLWVCAGTELELAGPRLPATPVLRLMRGELRADITHDPARPFSIDTPEARLRVLGTQFTCRVLPAVTWKENDSMSNLREALHKAMLIVTVLSGAVAVSPAGAAERIVPEGQRAVVAASGTATETLRNLGYIRTRLQAAQAAPKAEAYVFMPVREALMSGLWAVDLQSGAARHVTDFVGWPWLQAQFPAGLGIVNVGGVIYANFGREPISGAGNPIVGERPMLVDLTDGRKIPITPLEQFRPVYLDLSPDGRKLAFTGTRKPAENTAPAKLESGVYVMDLETFKVDLLLPGAIKTCPHWSPDSRWLAVSKAEDYVMEHAIVLLDTATRQVVETGLKGAGVVFSPDGKRLVFSSGFKRGGSWSAGVPTWGNLFIADFPKGEARQLTTLAGGGAIRPVFSPDGAALAWWESVEKKPAKLHVLDLAKQTDRVAAEGDAFGETQWLEGHSRLLVSEKGKKTAKVKLIDLEGPKPQVREITPEVPKASGALLDAQKAQAEQLYKVFVIYAAAVRAQGQQRLASAQQAFAEGRDLLKTISEATSKTAAGGVGPEDLAPYLDKFTAEAALDPSARAERIVSDNLHTIGIILTFYYRKYQALPTAGRGDDPKLPTFEEVARGRAGLAFQINQIRSTDAALLRPLFLMPGDDPEKVATSFRVARRDPLAGVLILETPPLPNGKRLQATYTLQKGNSRGRFECEIKTTR